MGCGREFDECDSLIGVACEPNHRVIWNCDHQLQSQDGGAGCGGGRGRARAGRGGQDDAVAAELLLASDRCPRASVRDGPAASPGALQRRRPWRASPSRGSTRHHPSACVTGRAPGARISSRRLAPLRPSLVPEPPTGQQPQPPMLGAVPPSSLTRAMPPAEVEVSARAIRAGHASRRWTL